MRDSPIGLEDIQRHFSRLAATARATQRYTFSWDFEQWVKTAPADTLQRVLNATTTAQIKAIMGLPLLSYRELRELAKNNHVKNYSRMEKAELITALENKKVVPPVKKE